MSVTNFMNKFALCGLAAILLTVKLNGFDGVQMKQAATDFTSVAKAAIPGVVSIIVKESRKGGQNWREEDDEGQDLQGGNFWEKFFGFPFGGSTPSEPREGQGSGFIVSADGYIITNGHVVRDTSEIIVHLHDGREYPAKVIGQDLNTDIALIKIDASNLAFLKLGNSDAIEVGEWVVAIGTPIGLEASLTTGVVSAKGRNNLSLVRVEDFIQTDASLYLGNSGGPLLNLAAEVIGINTAIASKMGGYIGIGFAIPSNIAKNVMDQLISKGSVSRGFIGVLLQDINPDLAQSFGLKKPQGALIAMVSKDSPAEKAGIKQGDVIISYNKIPVNSVAALRTAIAMMSPGTSLQFSIMRENKLQDITVMVGEFADAAAAYNEISTPEPAVANLGLSVVNLTPEIAQKLGLHGEKGVVITKVEPGSVAKAAGLNKGALIISVNQQKVDSVQDFQNILKAADAEKPYLFLVKEGQAVKFISFKSKK